jgi:PPM family protein phosphatase
MKVRPGVELASLTDVGCERENNEDSYGYWESEDDQVFERLGRLVTVADGMGGSEGGQFASRIGVDTVEEVYSAASGGDPQRALLDAFLEAHRRVQGKARETRALKGMGTTLTAFALVGNRLHFAHVGDSRIYRLRTGKLEVLTHDHSLVSRLVENGVIRAEEAGSHPQRHVLIAAVGVAEQVEPDFPAEPLPVEKSDVLMACSDGLWTQVSEEEIIRELASKTPIDACRSLVGLAKEHGGPDNITLEVVRIS